MTIISLYKIIDFLQESLPTECVCHMASSIWHFRMIKMTKTCPFHFHYFITCVSTAKLEIVKRLLN